MTESPGPPKRIGRAAALIAVSVTALNALSISIVLPILPAIAISLAADSSTTQLVLSSYLMALAVGQIPVGVLADRFGRRPVLMAGIGLFLIGGLIAALSGTVEVAVAGRFLQGLGGSAGIVISRAVVRDLFDRERAASVYGYMTMGFAVAPMIGPAIGGFVADAVGWRTVFYGLIAIALAVGTAVWRFLPETLPPETAAARRSLVTDISALVSVPAFWAFSLMIAFQAGTYFSFLGGAPFIATERIGLSATAVGGFLAFVSFGFMAGNLVAGRLVQRVGIPLMINIGNGVLCVAIGAMIVLYALGRLDAWTLFLPVAVMGFGNGIAMPGGIAGSVSVRPDLAGTASGISGTLQFGVGAVASAIAGAAVAAAPFALVLAVIMGVFAVLTTAMGVWSRFARS